MGLVEAEPPLRQSMAHYGLHLLEIHQFIVPIGSGQKYVGRNAAILETVRKGTDQRKEAEQKRL